MVKSINFQHSKEYINHSYMHVDILGLKINQVESNLT